jgi:hypothetical protein
LNSEDLCDLVGGETKHAQFTRSFEDLMDRECRRNTTFENLGPTIDVQYSNRERMIVTLSRLAAACNARGSATAEIDRWPRVFIEVGQHRSDHGRRSGERDGRARAHGIGDGGDRSAITCDELHAPLL